MVVIYHVAQSPSPDGLPYDAKAVVLFSEVVKLLGSCLLGVFEVRSVWLFVRLVVVDLRTSMRWLQVRRSLSKPAQSCSSPCPQRST